MPEPTDPTEEPKEEPKTSPDPSLVNYEEQAKHFQSIADQRDAALKTALEELNKLKADREAEEKKKLEEQGEYQKIAEQAQAKADAAEKEKQQLALQVALQNHLATEHPDYAADSKWIAPHVTDADSIASVVSDYVKAHPRQVGVGAASMGNTGQQPGGVKITRADVGDPAKLAQYAAKDPEFERKLLSGEIEIID
jgi:hypothetical protein